MLISIRDENARLWRPIQGEPLHKLIIRIYVLWLDTKIEMPPLTQLEAIQMNKSKFINCTYQKMVNI